MLCIQQDPVPQILVIHRKLKENSRLYELGCFLNTRDEMALLGYNFTCSCTLRIAWTFILATLMTLSVPVRPSLFEFRLVQTRQGADAGVEMCRKLGYNGLAVTSSPEAYAYSLRLSQKVREDNGIGLYLGLHFHVDSEALTWDDGKPPAADLPWEVEYSEEEMQKRSHGYQYNTGTLKMGFASHEKFALCGNFHNLPTEAHGSTTRGQQPTSVSSSLSMTHVTSYLECVLLCGQDHRCRVAEFNTDRLTCRTLGPGSYKGFIENPQYQTFVRIGFSV